MRRRSLFPAALTVFLGAAAAFAGSAQEARVVDPAGVSAGQATMAQAKRLTATPLAPERTISAPKEARVATRAQESSLQTTAALVYCDVTIAPGTSPAGYLPLAGFGITPVPGVTDDSVTDFSVSSFTFAGETYNKVGFSSNGYAIVGGSTGPADNSINNQNFPDATHPNNVLAPFWTDLNPAAAGALRIAKLTNGVDTWIVMDWANVREFSTANSNSFEIWIGVDRDSNPAEDISFAYGTIQGSGDLGFLTVGAENRFGTHGQNTYFNGTGTLPAAGADLRVTTTSCDVIFKDGFDLRHIRLAFSPAARAFSGAVKGENGASNPT